MKSNVPIVDQTPREYSKREIFVHRRYISCQILNWDQGPPPKYLICHPLDPQGYYKHEFFARQGVGTWMAVDLREVLNELDKANDKIKVSEGFL